jgi:hypothetical protein
VDDEYETRGHEPSRFVALVSWDDPGWPSEVDDGGMRRGEERGWQRGGWRSKMDDEYETRGPEPSRFIALASWDDPGLVSGVV